MQGVPNTRALSKIRVQMHRILAVAVEVLATRSGYYPSLQEWWGLTRNRPKQLYARCLEPYSA